MSSSYSSGARLPTLRPNCDANIQIAFSECNWAKTITFAKQLFKRTQDPYYEAIEVCARVGLDTPADKIAPFVALEKIIAENKPVKDNWTIELFEWATSEINKDYSQTIGKLRATFVKEYWKPDVDKSNIAVRSYWYCALQDDWENAQAIAATVDKKFPNDSRHMFFNILAYHMLGATLPEGSPKRELSRHLAARLIDKARDLRDSTPASSRYPARAIANEDQLLLWLRVQITSTNSNDELRNLLRKPEFDALKHLAEGFSNVFKEIMILLVKCEAWRDVYDIAQKLFDRALAYTFEDANASLPDHIEKDDEIAERLNSVVGFAKFRAEEIGKARKEIESTAFRSMVMDGEIWIQFIKAASYLDNSKRALKQLRGFIAKVSKVTKIQALQKHTLEIANLTILFNRHHSARMSDSTTSPLTRVEHLITFIQSNYNQVICFDSITDFLVRLSHDEVDALSERLEQAGSEDGNELFKNITILSLRLKILYMMTTLQKHINERGVRTHPSCKFCDADIKGNSCNACLQSIAITSARLYNQYYDNRDLRVRIEDKESVDPFADLAIVGATSLIKLSGLHTGVQGMGISSDTAIDLRLLIRGIAWLERQQNRGSQKGSQITLFLTKLYLLIGCVPQAHSLWKTLEVKNVTLDSLGPLFSDRLSTIAPGMWRAGASTPMTQYHRYFKDAILRHFPAQLQTALENANYMSVLSLMGSKDNFRNSCTMIMTNVEDRRGLRAIGSRYAHETNDDPLLRLIKENYDFEVATDNAALSTLECPNGTTLAEIISIGPSLSDSRVRMSWYAEKFLSLMSSRESKEYKPAKSTMTADNDRVAVAEQSIKIRETFGELLMIALHAPDSATRGPTVTSGELSYFTTVHNLADLTALGTAVNAWTKNSQRPGGVLRAVKNIVAELKDQQNSFTEPRPRIPADVSVLGQFVSLHSLGMLRESIIAVKTTVNYLERVIAASKDAPKWLSEDCGTLNNATAEVSAVVKQQIKALNDDANAPGWFDRIAQYTFGDLASGAQVVGEPATNDESSALDSALFTACGGLVGLEHTIGEIQESWREVAKGWTTVKLD
ncbi:hypothetical protein E8E14_000281 [Neopestalotiopsis sp. 37M]|nr:hypothetical protein E8E14_000281 [Neopestalotiopsis sp. 37M]